MVTPDGHDFLCLRYDVIARLQLSSAIHGPLEHDAVHGAVDSFVAPIGDDNAVPASEPVDVAHTETVATGYAGWLRVGVNK